MTLMGFLILLLIAAICGGIGQALAGYDLGGCLVSIIVGFIGAYIGTWLAGKFGFPPIFEISVQGERSATGISSAPLKINCDIICCVQVVPDLPYVEIIISPSLKSKSFQTVESK